jgi:hypothetical protein
LVAYLNDPSGFDQKCKSMMKKSAKPQELVRNLVESYMIAPLISPDDQSQEFVSKPLMEVKRSLIKELLHLFFLIGSETDQNFVNLAIYRKLA